MAKRPITIDDLLRIRTPSDPQMSPDGTRVAFVVRTMDAEKNKNRAHIRVVPASGEAPRHAPARQWTHSDGSEGSPRWSPDGKYLAFTSGREEKREQIFLLPTDGGEAERVTDLPEGDIADLRWSPEGARIAFTFRPQDPERRDEAEEERKKNHRSTPPRTITRLHFREEGKGFVPAERYHVHVLDIATRSVRPITAGDRDHGPFCWSPDGARLAIVSNRADDPDLLPNAEDLFVFPAEGLPDGAEPTKLPCPLGPKSDPAWSPDGGHIAYLGHDKADEIWGVTNVHPWIVPANGGAGTARDLTPDWDTEADSAVIGDVNGGGEGRPVWSADGASLVVLASERGAVNLYRVSITGDSPPERLTGGEQATLGFTAAGSPESIALLIATSEDAGDIYVFRNVLCDSTADPSEPPRRLTRLNQELFDEAAVSPPVAFDAPAPEGHAVPGWAVLPSEGRGHYPTIVYVHGGPHLMYGHTLFHEFQALAAAGYVVLCPNPRGSKGYGEAWTGAIRGNWGEPAGADVLACVDHAVARGWTDPRRVGIAGGSYGGYLAAWLIGNSNRFAAAAAERGVYNLQSMAGTCDFVWTDRGYFDANTWDDPAAYLRNSPLTYAGNITTPLMILHAEGDLRCPIEQAEQLFAALKRQRREVVFVRYGREANHDLSRHGPPDLRLDRQRRIHAWFDKWLK